MGSDLGLFLLYRLDWEDFRIGIGMKSSYRVDIEELLRQVSEREKCDPEDISWWSWPEMFPTTSGPHGGISGQAITKFQVFGFEPPSGKRQKFCAGVWRHWDGEFSW